MIIPLILLMLFFAPGAAADMVHLKNGGIIEGVIEREDKDKIEINMGFGSATFEKRQVEAVRRSSFEDNNELLKRWTIRKKDLDAKTKEFEEAREKRFDSASEYWTEDSEQKKAKGPGETKHIRIARDERTRSLIVETILNGKVKANLVLDTGASLVVLSRRIGVELGIDMADNKNDAMKMKLADGRMITGKAVILESVRIQDVEMNKVMAAVMIEDVNDSSLRDGLLGMSFLSRFNLNMDLKNMKITLEKIAETEVRER